MMNSWRANQWILSVAAICVLTAVTPVSAQKQPASSSAEKTREILEANAHALESRDRPDMAIQIWQQILLSDPNNPEALAGLARDYKLSGSNDKSDRALEKLRSINPNDPNIARIQAMTSNKSQSEELRRAGELARQGRNADAMKVYRQLYGDHPPEGDIALAYYQTMYGTTSGKQDAIAAMRALAQKNPSDPRYSVELGRMLTYDPKTRPEGIHILQQHSLDPNARNALRQALIWDSANPASAAELREYVKEHPGDTEIAEHLREDESKLAQMNSGIARTPEERAAFAALNAHKLADAEARFTKLLEKEPNNGRVDAGMGFLRMQQQNFGGAVSYLTQAEQNGYKSGVVENALSTSRFWYTMGEASQALDGNQLEVAQQKYKDALTMRPRSTDALSGLAGLYLKEEKYAQATGVYQDLLKLQPSDVDAWRGLFVCYARDGQSQQALDVAAKAPVRVKAELNKDPEYLRTLATIYSLQGRSIDAQYVLSQALALPFPEGGAHLQEDTRMQYAAILMQAHRFAQAAAMYTQILNEDGNSLPAWMGLVSARHELGQDSAAIGDVEKMPPAVYESALSDAGFLTLLGSMYQQANQFDVAQSLLERSVKLSLAQGRQPSLQLQMQLAGVYLKRGNTTQAYAIYRQALTAHPERADAWKGLISTLQATNRSQEALHQLAYIPPVVRKELEKDPDFVQTEASIYASAGDIPHATEYMLRVQRHYAQAGQQMPANLAIQGAWILYNTGDDRSLYPALMKLGARADLTVPQRETVQTIWANWAVKRAGAAIDRNENQRAVEILEAASRAFPDNIEVKRVLAGGYLRTGQSRASLALYKSLSMEDAGVNDYQGAIGAALAANDKAQAEVWLREALERFPHDYRILGVAAKFEQARGDIQRSADYWRAALAAMPAGSPTDRLAHDLAYPDQDTTPHKATSAADLQRLLDPNYAEANEPFQKTVKLPPLPAYGPDPYLGAAPVVLQPPPQTVAREYDPPTAPTITEIAVPERQTPNPPAPQSSIGQSGSVAADASESSTAKHGKAARHGKVSAEKRATPSVSGNSGSTTPPSMEENTTSTDAVNAPLQPAAPQAAAPQSLERESAPPLQPSQDSRPTLRVPGPQDPQVFIPEPQAASAAPEAGQQSALRLSDQPENGQAAETPVVSAESSDSELAQPQDDGKVRALGNAPVTLPGNADSGSAPEGELNSEVGPPAMTDAQYTPSAQEAATGAYSAQKQQSSNPAPASPQTTPATQPTQPAPPKHRARKRKATRKERVPTLATAPSDQNPSPAVPLQTQPTQLEPQPQPQEQAPAETSAPGGLTDEQLQQQNLPPLRGPWVRVQRQPRVTSPREEAEQQLEALESSYSGWLAGTGVLNYRSGDLGYSRLAALEAPFEASAPLGYGGRFTLIARPVFLDSGQADGTSVITVQEATTGGRLLVTIPQPLGTATNTGPVAGSTLVPNPPAQQNASGIGGELQFTTSNLTLGFGYTPFGFLVANWTARAQWRPGNGPLTFGFSRDSVRDSQLSYSGLRDPGTASLSFPGTIWGGVMADQGNVQFSRGDAISGFYMGVGGQYLTGYNTENNWRVDGNGGAYWRVKSYPEFGILSVGTNFFAMHYNNNQGGFTFGMGGYFSPQAYFLANVPITWVGHSRTRWHYQVVGGLGIQAFQQDLTPLFPLPGQKASEIGLNNAALPALTSVGANYDIRADAAYQISQHWFAGGFVGGNNARNYNSAMIGFGIHYLFRTQPSMATAPTGLFPHEGLRPFTVP